MIKRTLFAALLLTVAVPLHADFRSVERALTLRLGSPTYIPLFGLVRFGTWIVHPDGVHDIQLAVYEGKGKALDGEEMEALVAREVPRGFSPIIRTRSRGEWTFIYAKPGSGDRIELFLVSHDHEDTVLMRVDVDAERAGEQIGRKVMSKMASK